MADFRAISVAAHALRALLLDACAGDYFPGLKCELAAVPGLVTAPFETGLSIALYRVAFNGNRRALPPRKLNGSRTCKPSVPLDLHFLITAWGKPDKQWALLARAIRALEDTPVLHAGVLNQSAGNEPGLAADVFRADEILEIVGESLSQQDLLSIWEPAKSTQQPSVSYLVRSVLIDSEIEQFTPLAQTRVFDLAASVP